MRTGLRTDRAAGLPLRVQPAGHALLIHPRSGADPQALAFAAGLAPDTQHTLVVVDLPFGGLEEAWERVARLLGGRPGSLRLVFGRATPAESRAAGQRIADRLDRTVLVPDGELLPTAGGGLFIPADHGSGWLRLRPGRPGERDSHRFPKPLWEFSTLDRPWETSPYGVVEAVPSGVWVRSTRPDPPLAGWRRLVEHLPSDPQIMNVVLGSPGGPAVPLADVVRFWGTVLHSVRSWVRFVHYGPVSLPEGSVSLGQELADAFEQQVVLYAGMPTTEGTSGGPARIRGLHADGSPGWLPFAAELVYSPGGGQAMPPALVGLRVPVTEVPQLAAGVYQYAADAVLEIVQAGLWLRPAEEPPGGDDVRRLQGGPGRPVILYDRSTPQAAERMRTLAQDMLWRLDPESRDAFRIAAADAPGTTTATDDEDAWRLPPTPEEWRVVAAAKAARRRPAHQAPWSTPLPPTAEQVPPTAEQAGPVAGPLAAGASHGHPAPAVAGGAEHPADHTGPAASNAAPHGPAHAAPVSAAPVQTVPVSAAPVSAAPVQTVPVQAGPDPVAVPAASTAARPRTESAQDGWGGIAPTPPAATAASGFGPPSPPAPPWARTPAAPVAPERIAPETTPAPPDAPAGTPAPEGSAVPAPPVRLGEGPEQASAAGPDSAYPAEPDVPGGDSGSATGQADAPGPGPIPGPAPGAGSGTPAPLPADLLSEGPAPSRGPDAPPAPAPAPAPVEPARAQPMPIPRIRMESEAPTPVAAEPERDGNGTPAVPVPPAAAGVPLGGTPGPGAGSGGVRVQPVPRAAACAVPPERGIDQERAWVRRTFSAQYNAIAGSVSRVMSESPGLRGVSRAVSGDTLTDLVAVRLYLSGDSAAVDQAVRAATVGSHVPLARCVASGLRRLPSYRGTALLRTRISAAERGWYREGRLATEWAFCTARTDTHPAPAQGTDFLIWSMTARRTNLLDPGAPDRVLFLPGTAFKVLRCDDGDRPTVLLRELSPSEIAEDGRVEVQRVPLDEIALESLERSVASLRLDGPVASPRGESEPPVGPPGLIVAPPRARPAADRGRPIEGAVP